jgi:hypothetical protein
LIVVYCVNWLNLQRRRMKPRLVAGFIQAINR